MIYVDTNVIVDLLLERENCELAKEAVLKIIADNKEACLSATSFTDICYILHRNLKNMELEKNALEIVADVFHFIPTDGMHIREALKLEWKDIEDSVVYVSAKDAGCELIVTNNVKDFEKAQIPICTSQEYLSQ